MEAKWIEVIGISSDLAVTVFGPVPGEVTLMTIECDGESFRKVVRTHKDRTCDDNKAAGGPTDWEDEVLSKGFLPMSWEEILRLYDENYYCDSGKMILEQLDATRMGMTPFEYRVKLEAEQKKAKAVARAEARLAKLKAA